MGSPYVVISFHVWKLIQVTGPWMTYYKTAYSRSWIIWSPEVLSNLHAYMTESLTTIVVAAS